MLLLREALEDQGVDEAEIEAKTSEMRKSLLAQLPSSAPKARNATPLRAWGRGDISGVLLAVGA